MTPSDHSNSLLSLHVCQFFGPTTDFLRAAAGVVSQTDDHLSCPMAHWRGHTGAVVLHGDNGVVVAEVHAAPIFRGLPNLAVRTGNAGAVSAGCGQTVVMRWCTC